MKNVSHVESTHRQLVFIPASLDAFMTARTKGIHRGIESYRISAWKGVTATVEEGDLKRFHVT